MSIANITRLAKGNFSRDNRFGVHLPEMDGDLHALIQSTSLPGLNFHTAQWRNVGHGIKYAYDAAFPEIQMSFIDTADMKIQTYFTEWSKKIYINEGNQKGFAYPDDYRKDVKIFKYNKKDTNPVMTYLLKDAFPITLTEVSLNTAGQNTMSTLNIILSYTDWELE